jgi:hypothetical protein
MKRTPAKFLLIFSLLILLATGCASPAPATVVERVVVTQAVVVEVPAEAPPAAATAAPLATPAPESQEAVGGKAQPISPPQAERLIIKNAEARLLVEDTDVAIDRLTQVVDDVGGYIISSRVWYQESYGENYMYSTITMGVPVDRFEDTLRRLRQLSLRVLDEVASGEDVTDEYVDLESRLRNLEATRDRIREFLSQAKTVEEALKVNEQLSEVEAEIEQVKGRMNYLFDRAAFSTITVHLEPDIPPFTPTVTPTPTATPTPTVTPTATPWNPGRTLNSATRTLGSVMRGMVEAAIWLCVVVVPALAVPAAILFGLWYIFFGRRRRKEQKATAMAVPPQAPTPEPVKPPAQPKSTTVVLEPPEEPEKGQD